MSDWVNSILMPWLGTITAILIWVVSIDEIRQARLKKDIGELDPIPFVIGWSSCIAWTFYSMCIGDLYVFFSNFPGVVLMTFYVLSILVIVYRNAWESPEKMEKYLATERLFMFMVGFFVMVPLAVLIIDDHQMSSDMVGMIATVVNLLFFIAPCTVIIEVVRTEDASALFLPMLTANFICSVCWFCYGLFALNDVWIYGVNAVGTFLQGTFVAMRLWYGNEKSKSQQRATDESLPLSSEE
jgi:uncharacterized protein with PQ loop repeat